MSDFRFSLDASPEEHISAFLDHLYGLDSEMATVLHKHIANLLPLPDQTAARRRARASFNDGVRRELEKMEELEDKRGF